MSVAAIRKGLAHTSCARRDRGELGLLETNEGKGQMRFRLRNGWPPPSVALGIAGSGFRPHRRDRLGIDYNHSASYFYVSAADFYDRAHGHDSEKSAPAARRRS